MSAEPRLAKPRRTRWGCEDLVGKHVTWSLQGRTYLVDVIDQWFNETTGAWMLKTRHFNGDAGPDVAVMAVHVLVRTYEPRA